MGGRGVELGVTVGILVSLAVGVRVPKLSRMITLGVTVGNKELKSMVADG